MLKHNEDVKAGRPVTPEDRAHARDLAERIATDGAAAAEDIFSGPETSETAPAVEDMSGADFLDAISPSQD
jgi:hypothetical protein